MDTVLIAWASVLGAVCAAAGLIRSVRRASKQHDEQERDQYARALDKAYNRGYQAGKKDAETEQREHSRDKRIADLERQLRERGQ